MAAAEDQGVAIDYDAAREHVYGMPYDDWKAQFQKPATAEQIAEFEKNNKV